MCLSWLLCPPGCAPLAPRLGVVAGGLLALTCLSSSLLSCGISWLVSKSLWAPKQEVTSVCTAWSFRWRGASLTCEYPAGSGITLCPCCVELRLQK